MNLMYLNNDIFMHPPYVLKGIKNARRDMLNTKVESIVY